MSKMDEMKPHLIQAQNYWKSHLSSGDLVVDATLGNGHDIYFLASLLQGAGTLVGYDIQASALEKSRARLSLLPLSFQKNITLKEASHHTFEEKEVNLFVYNLGYLPGGDKNVTTQTKTTLISLQEAIGRLAPKGAISLMTYPGHLEGKKEQEAILHFLSTLPSSSFEIIHHMWINRPLFPTLLWLKAL